MRGARRHWLPAWPWKRVLVLWLGLTLVIGVTVLAWVLPLPDGPLRLSMVAAQVLSPVVILIVGAVLAFRAPRPWLVVVGMVALLWAAIKLPLGCPASACPVPPGYEHWRNIKINFNVSIAGPQLLLTSRTEPCAFDCPYTIQLIPLAIGYLIYAHTLTTEN